MTNAWRYHEGRLTPADGTILDGGEPEEKLAAAGYQHEQTIGDDGGLSLGLFIKYEPQAAALEPRWVVLVSTASYWFPVFIDGLGDFLDFIGRFAAGFAAAGFGPEEATALFQRFTEPARKERQRRASAGPALPPRPTSGGRWSTTPRKLRHYQCPKCGHVAPQAPAVMAYVPELDYDGGQALKHPDWPILGYLAWWDCARCLWTKFSAVAESQVAEWGRKLGGWQPLR
jgi:hypothetical protein